MKQKLYYFEDNVRIVDFVLVIDPDKLETNALKCYLESLEIEGLQLEIEERCKLKYLKVHAPQDVLFKYCDALQIRLPIRDGIVGDDYVPVRSSFRLNCFSVGDNEYKYKPCAEFLTSRLDLFDMHSEDFFIPSLRSMIVNIALNKVPYGNLAEEIGLDKILNEEILDAAYPLHDGLLDGESSERLALHDEWGSFDKVCFTQPLDRIKDYFGVKIGLYFLWLGFYTFMLIPASIVGVICLIFGVATLSQDHFSQEVCDSNTVMCPQCDVQCDFWNLKDACTYTRITYLFDNDLTVFFAGFMSIWSTLYLELWKRYSAEMTHHWGLTGFDLHSEYPRPEYLSKKNRKGSIRFWRDKVPSLLFSFTTVVSIALLAVGAVFSVIIYRISIRASLTFFDDDKQKTFFIPITAGLMNLVAIFILNKIYSYVALKVTDLEYQRTQAEFDDSLTLKIYIFQFVNFYSSIFYIAFFKGKLVGYPENYNRIFNYRQEECSPGGCLMELCMQLAIIMIGKQGLNNIIEILVPYIKNVVVKCMYATEVHCNYHNKVGNQVAEDYVLEQWSSRSLFPEYLEMVIQYGFVTIFVTAFPLAPLFALINNIIEIRLDAKKFITFYRRSVAERVKDIGVWYKIIHVISGLSVITNALIIAFSSNFIPQLVYKMTVSKDFTEKGYVDFSLSKFNVSDLQHLPKNSQFNVTECSYTGFRTPPSAADKYQFTDMHWHVLAARLAFVVVYQNVVTLIIMIVQMAIPDMPGKIRKLIKKESQDIRNYLIRNQSTLQVVPNGTSRIQHRKYAFENRSYDVHQ